MNVRFLLRGVENASSMTAYSEYPDPCILTVARVRRKEESAKSAL